MLYHSRPMEHLWNWRRPDRVDTDPGDPFGVTSSAGDKATAGQRTTGVQRVDQGVSVGVDRMGAVPRRFEKKSTCIANDILFEDLIA